METALPEDEAGIAALVRQRADDLSRAIYHAAKHGISVDIRLQSLGVIGEPNDKIERIVCSIAKAL